MTAAASPIVTVLVLCTNEKHLLDDCLGSLLCQTYQQMDIYLLDNNSTDGSVEYVKEKFQSVKILHFESNLGYSIANNIGLKEGFNKGSDFCLVLNSDVKCHPGMIEEMLETYSRSKSRKEKVGLIQPVILLFDEPDKLNTVGNAIHYLGFGYCADYKRKYVPLQDDKEISSASGAALLIHRDYFEDIGLINEEFFMYSEDQNYSWRGLLQGYKHFVSAKAEMLHKYRFKSYPFKMYHAEKNRLMILLENYEFKTLLLLAPIIIVNGGFLFIHALLNGWFTDKLRSVIYVLSHLRMILKTRKRIQKRRLVGDKQIMKYFESRLDFEATNNKLIQNFVNPLYALYYKVVMKIL